MASLTVRDIPDELYAKFKKTASRDRRSVNSEVIVALDTFVQQTELQVQRREAWDSISRRMESKPSLGGNSVEMLREDRER